jgi:acetyl esterase/lipase
MIAACAEYRIKNTHGTTPLECVADAKSAVRWLRENARRLGIDSNKIAAGGGSAGGHLAACTALVHGFDEKNEDLSVSSKPNLLVLFNPALDTSGMTEKFDQYAKDLSPDHNVKKSTPATIVFHGTADTVVPFEQATRFRDLMTAAGNVCELMPYEGKQHGFFNYGSDQDHHFFNQTIRQMDAFLSSRNFLKK